MIDKQSICRQCGLIYKFTRYTCPMCCGPLEVYTPEMQASAWRASVGAAAERKAQAWPVQSAALTGEQP